MTTPESYLALLSGKQPEHIHTSFEGDRRTLDFLNALALVCISQASRQAIAVAFELHSSESPVVRLYISSNNALDKDTKTHIRQICKELVAISSLSCDRPPKAGGWSEDVSQRRRLLGLKIFNFCHKKILKRWMRRVSNWEEYAKKYREILVSRDELAVHVDYYDRMMGYIETGYRRVQEDPHDWRLSDGIATVMNIKGFRPMIQRIDALAMYMRGSSWSLEHYIDKITDHSRSLDTLVRFAASKGMRALLSKPLVLRFVDPLSREVCIDITLMKEEFPSAFEGNRPFVPLDQQSNLTYDTTPHCELTLLAHFMDQGRFGVSPAIGVSKPSCFGCSIGFEALNAVLKAHFPEFPEPFFTSGEHTKIYQEYAYPTFFPRGPIMEGHVQEKLNELLRNHFRTNLYDSTASSSSWPGIGKSYETCLAEADQFLKEFNFADFEVIPDWSCALMNLTGSAVTNQRYDMKCALIKIKHALYDDKKFRQQVHKLVAEAGLDDELDDEVWLDTEAGLEEDSLDPNVDLAMKSWDIVFVEHKNQHGIVTPVWQLRGEPLSTIPALHEDYLKSIWHPEDEQCYSELDLLMMEQAFPECVFCKSDDHPPDHCSFHMMPKCHHDGPRRG